MTFKNKENYTFKTYFINLIYIMSYLMRFSYYHNLYNIFSITSNKKKYLTQYLIRKNKLYFFIHNSKSNYKRKSFTNVMFIYKL